MMNSIKHAGASLLVLLPPFSAWPADDLSPLSDEFDDPARQTEWRRVFEVEGWGADQLEVWDVDASRPGRMVMMPHVSTWYRDWRGVLAFKEITGDFVATTEVEPTSRQGSGAPQAQFSLAGILSRTPRSGVTNPASWTPGGENYIFLSLGTGNNPGTFQYEVKTTTNSDSTLILSAGFPRATIQVARLGPSFITLHRNPGEDWTVHRRYTRTDMPETLQVGMTTYTDWPTVSAMDPFIHNQTVISGRRGRNSIQ